MTDRREPGRAATPQPPLGLAILGLALVALGGSVGLVSSVVAVTALTATMPRFTPSTSASILLLASGPALWPIVLGAGLLLRRGWALVLTSHSLLVLGLALLPFMAPLAIVMLGVWAAVRWYLLRPGVRAACSAPPRLPGLPPAVLAALEQHASRLAVVGGVGVLCLAPGCGITGERTAFVAWLVLPSFAVVFLVGGAIVLWTRTRPVLLAAAVLTFVAAGGPVGALAPVAVFGFGVAAELLLAAAVAPARRPLPRRYAPREAPTPDSDAAASPARCAGRRVRRGRQRRSGSLATWRSVGSSSGARCATGG